MGGTFSNTVGGHAAPVMCSAPNAIYYVTITVSYDNFAAMGLFQSLACGV